MKITAQTNESNIKRLSRENAILTRKVDELTQYSMKYNVIIQGMSGTKGEDLRKTVELLANKLEVNINNYNIRVAHQVPSQKK